MPAKKTNKKFIAVCEAFRMPSTYERWRYFAKLNPGLEVTLIAPAEYEDRTWPKVRIFKTQELDEPGFKVRTVNMKRGPFTKNGFLSVKLLQILRKEKPDFLYMIGYEVDNILMLLAFTRWFWDRDCIKIGFTMRGLPFPLGGLHYRTRWNITKNFYNAFCCHYPRAIEIIRNQGGFKGPIYMQTQVGVNKKVNYFSEDRRALARRKYALADDIFIFGMACRIEESKGVFDVLNALPFREDYQLFLMGDGVDKAELIQTIKKKGLEDRVILPGFIPMGEKVAEAMCALDAFIHFPKTTPTWIDTFPLAVVQAMATALPVIGSDSGAVPYQIGDDEMIVEEGNIKELKKKIVELLDNPKLRDEKGAKNLVRVQDTFEIEHLSKSFSLLTSDLQRGVYVAHHIDQANFKFEHV